MKNLSLRLVLLSTLVLSSCGHFSNKSSCNKSCDTTENKQCDLKKKNCCKQETKKCDKTKNENQCDVKKS